MTTFEANMLAVMCVYGLVVLSGCGLLVFIQWVTQLFSKEKDR